jgi:nucleotide-binding universal stress UspA family protein
MRTMLVPLDGSRASESVLPYALAVARGCGYRVALLSVWEVDEEPGRALATGPRR